MTYPNSEIPTRGAVGSGRGGPATATSGSQLIVFMVPGEPVPKARPRVARGRAYTPAPTSRAEGRIRQYLKVWYPHLRPSGDAFTISLQFQFRNAGRGDWDNYAKLVCDALNGIVWLDDRQIRRATVYMDDHFADPCTIISIESLTAIEARPSSAWPTDIELQNDDAPPMPMESC